MLRKFALVFAAGTTIVAGVALAPTEASAWYGCWGCGPYYYAGYRPYVYYPGYRYYRWRRPVYAYGWQPYYRPYYRPYWGWRRHW